VDQWAELVDPKLSRPRQEMVYNIHYKENDAPPVSAIRIGDWKYIWRAHGDHGWHVPPEQGGRKTNSHLKANNDIRQVLYNLATDPLEKEDLSEVYPERAEEMLAELKGYLQNMSNVTYPHEDNAGNPSHFNGIWSAGWC
jgi:arylsulfatase A-like enzyme